MQRKEQYKFEKFRNKDKLDLHVQYLTNKDAPELIAFIKIHGISELNLECNDIGIEAIKELATISTLTTLNLSGDSINDEAAKALAQSTSLKKLNLHANFITDVGIKALSCNPYLEELDISENNCSLEGAVALAGSKTLKKLTMSHLYRMNIVAAKAFANNNSLSSLTLICCFNHSEADEVVTILSSTPTLTFLDLSGNHIGNKGAIALSTNRFIKILKLYENRIGKEGAASLAQNSSIIDLDLGRNCVGNIGANAFTKNCSLIKLNLDGDIGDFLGDDISQETKHAIHEKLAENYFNLAKHLHSGTSKQEIEIRPPAALPKAIRLFNHDTKHANQGESPSKKTKPDSPKHN